MKIADGDGHDDVRSLNLQFFLEKVYKTNLKKLAELNSITGIAKGWGLKVEEIFREQEVPELTLKDHI